MQKDPQDGPIADDGSHSQIHDRTLLRQKTAVALLSPAVPCNVRPIELVKQELNLGIRRTCEEEHRREDGIAVAKQHQGPAKKPRRDSQGSQRIMMPTSALFLALHRSSHIITRCHVSILGILASICAYGRVVRHTMDFILEKHGILFQMR